MLLSSQSALGGWKISPEFEQFDPEPESPITRPE